MRKYKKAILIKSVNVANDIKSLTFNMDNIAKFIPGQFYIVRVKLENRFIEREYSIANSISDNHIELGIQKVKMGLASNYLYKLKTNNIIELTGPIGKYFNFEKKHPHGFVFISGGAGIIPIMSMIRSYPNKNFHLIASFKRKKDIPYFEEIKKNKKLKTTITLTREKWEGNTGRITKELLKDESLTSLFYICGRTSFVEDMRKILKSLKVKDENIRTERFG